MDDLGSPGELENTYDIRICGKNCKLCPVLQYTSRQTILNEVDCQSHNVVYWYSCNCGQHYVGKTTQMVRERFQQHIQYVLKSEVKDHRKICQQECKFKILETVIEEDILAREQAWIQLLGLTLNQDLSQLHLCALYRRDMMKEKREFMMHKKVEHRDTVLNCEKFNRGECT